MIASMLSLLLAIQPAPQTVPVASPPQDHAAKVDRFMAALPPSTRDETPDPEKLALAERDIKRLVALNPGKEAPIRAIVEARVRCGDAFSSSFAVKSLRLVADSLTDSELDQLTTLYSGPDYAKMLAAAEGSAEMKALMARYPLMRFYDATQKVMREQMASAFETFAQCESTADESFSAAGLKTLGGDAETPPARKP